MHTPVAENNGGGIGPGAGQAEVEIELTNISQAGVSDDERRKEALEKMDHTANPMIAAVRRKAESVGLAKN